MIVTRIDPADIADLPVPVATHGAIRALEAAADDLHEMLITIAIVVYETHPG